MSQTVDYNLYVGTKGKQGRYSFYTTTIKLREVYETFRFYLDSPEERGDYEVHATKSGRKKVIRHRDASVDQDAQRIRDPNKVDKIIDYMKTNKDNWIFSSITASCDSPIKFEESPLDPRIGTIKIRKGSKLLINDGQHRADAIGKLWNNDLEIPNKEQFGEQAVSVVIYEGKDLKRMQQMFIDLQKGTPVNKSLQHELSPDLDKILVREVRDSIPFFKDYVVKDETSVAKGSCKLFTLNSFYDANRYVFGSQLSDENYEEIRDFLISFWTELSHSIPEWSPFIENPKKDTDLFRKTSLSHLSVTMHAFGMIASNIYHGNFSLNRLSRLKNVNFNRSNQILLKKYTVNKRLANNPHVRRYIRDYLWQKVLKYKGFEQ